LSAYGLCIERFVTCMLGVMIGEELLTAIRLLKTGLRELNRTDGSTDFFHLPRLLLASGFERMMKTVICCHHLETTGDFPRRSVFPPGRRGHDLVLLLDHITRDCFSDVYLSRIPAAKSDISFLRGDPKLSSIVQILSDFGQSARYYNLNVVLDEQNPGPSLDDEWQKLEMEILQEDPSWAPRIRDPGAMVPYFEQRIIQHYVLSVGSHTIIPLRRRPDKTPSIIEEQLYSYGILVAQM
jgi:hypothetical protein